MKVAFRASLAGVGVLATLAGLVAFERDAWACSYGVPYQPGTLRCEAAPSADGVHTSIADAGFAVASAESGCSLSPTHSTRSTKRGPTTVAAPLWVGLCAALMAARRASSIATRPKARR